MVHFHKGFCGSVFWKEPENHRNFLFVDMFKKNDYFGSINRGENVFYSCKLLFFKKFINYVVDFNTCF